MEKKNVNSRLTIELMEQLHLFDSEMLEILKRNGVKNIQDLIDADLSKWRGLEPQSRLELEEAKSWYDFSGLEEDEQREINYNNIPLYNEKGLFSLGKTYKYLCGIGIVTVGDLLNNKEKVFGPFLADNKIRKDITIAIKLLECKYLGIDPGIEITEEDSMETIGEKLGFNTSTKIAFVASSYRSGRRYFLTPESFINIIKNCNEFDAREELLKIRSFGKNRVDEIYYKSSIILNCDRKNNKKELSNEDLVAIYSKKMEESKIIKKLDAQLDSELDSMLDEMASKGLLTEEIISKYRK